MTNCWIITEDLAGTRNQCIALAHESGFSYECKTIEVRAPWRYLMPWMRYFTPQYLTEKASPLCAPWPDIIIASGRKSITPALWVKRQTNNMVPLVIVQSPVIKDSQFDLVITPQHDLYRGDNVLQISGALSVISTETLQQAKKEWQSCFAHLPQPHIAVLIGGKSRTHRVTMDDIDNLLGHLRTLVAKNHGLMITCSRRTPGWAVQKLRHALSGYAHVYFWDNTGVNPYHGFLAYADVILVTDDSISMISEAISTAKPVYMIRLSGGSERFDRFYRHIIAKGFARWFDGKIDTWNYTPPQDLIDTAIAARELVSSR